MGFDVLDWLTVIVIEAVNAVLFLLCLCDDCACLVVKALDFLAVICIVGDFFCDDVLCALKSFFDRVYALFFADILSRKR